MKIILLKNKILKINFIFKNIKNILGLQSHFCFIKYQIIIFKNWILKVI